MSSIRLFILGSLAQHGEMHGHQLRLLAEEEHIHLWTDITVGALYGAIKRLATEGLIDVVRTEREGNYPERQVYGISAQGVAALDTLRSEALSDVTVRPDPVDLALSRLDPERLHDLPRVLDERLAAFRRLLSEASTRMESVKQYLSLAETHSMTHKLYRLQAEIDWLESLIADLPAVIEGERERQASDVPLSPVMAHYASADRTTEVASARKDN